MTAEGEGLTYQWYFRNEGSTKWCKSGVTDNTYDDVMTVARANREVYCVITNANGETLQTDIARIIPIKTELVIVTQPQNASAKLDEMFCSEVIARGDGLKYQWYIKNKGCDYWTRSTQNDSTYDDIMTGARNGREVYCVITDAWGNKVQTDTVKITGIVNETLEILVQPQNDSAKLGEMFCSEVIAKGDGLKYQWYIKNKGTDRWARSAQKDSTYDDIMTKLREGREIYCVITDAWGNRVQTDVVKLEGIVTEELAIVTQPTDASAALGERFCVTVEAKGDGIKYTWYIRNAGSSQWSRSSVTDNTYDDVMTKARAGREIYCVITDGWGNVVTTEIVTLVCT